MRTAGADMTLPRLRRETIGKRNPEEYGPCLERRASPVAEEDRSRNTLPATQHLASHATPCQPKEYFPRCRLPDLQASIMNRKVAAIFKRSPPIAIEDALRGGPAQNELRFVPGGTARRSSPSPSITSSSHPRLHHGGGDVLLLSPRARAPADLSLRNAGLLCPIPNLFKQLLDLLAVVVPPQAMQMVERILAGLLTPHRGGLSPSAC